jgi:hypothetical protein
MINADGRGRQRGSATFANGGRMPSLGSHVGSTALLLLVAAAACGESPTEWAERAERQRAAYGNALAKEAEPEVPAVVQPVVFTIETKLGTSTALIEHMPPGFTPPPGQFYGFDVRGTGFPPGKGFDFQLLARFINDGTVFVAGAGGGGVVPADGTFRTGGAASCPTQYSEMWVVVTAAGRKYESPHWAPPRC